MSAGAPAIFVDRDGTLMQEVDYCRDPRLVRVFDGAGDALRLARSRGYRIILVTNQSGIGRGMISVAEYEAVHAEFARQLGEGTLDGTYYCPDAPGVPSTRRKPEPGMLLEAARDHSLDLGASWMIGDKEADIEAGHRAGARSILVRTGYGAANRESRADAIVKDVVEAVRGVILEGTWERS
jgi:D-glycero-D-manno-heptose 1,7-bisphosphate phosphatase